MDSLRNLPEGQGPCKRHDARPEVTLDDAARNVIGTEESMRGRPQALMMRSRAFFFLILRHARLLRR